MRRILVTGASTWTGGRLIAELERRDDVRVFGVDEIPQRIPFRSSFAQLSMDRTGLAEHLLDIEPEIVVHLLTVDRAAELGRSRAHEQAVIGGQALFGAIGRSTSVRRVVVKSDAAIYPMGPRSPSVYQEDAVRLGQITRYGRELDDLENLIAALVPIHDHVDYLVLRLAPIFGARVANPISQYLNLPIIPSILGYDPRIQIIHEDDAVAAFVAAVDSDATGTINIGAGSPVYLSRIARLGHRHGQPLPRRGFDAALRSLGRMGQNVPEHVVELINHGVVLDTDRMTGVLGFTPAVNGRAAVVAGYDDGTRR